MGGLANVGSTCAVNSLIQMLCNDDDIRKLIINNKKDDKNSLSLSKEIGEVFDLLHNQNKSLRPKKLIFKIYKEFSDFFRLGEQLDICELWMCIHQKISQEHGDTINVEKCIEPKFNDIDNLIPYCNYIISKHNDFKISEWSNITQGILMNYIKCEQCNEIIYNFEPFILLPLDIGKNNNIASMIGEFIKPYCSQGDWKCEKCNEYTKYIKINQIWKFPKKLILMIKRFDEKLDKNCTEIDINQELNIKITNKQINYNLSSLAVHYGNMNNGHYVSLCKINNQLKLFDDLKIFNIKDDFLQKNKEAYLVWYDLI